MKKLVLTIAALVFVFSIPKLGVSMASSDIVVDSFGQSIPQSLDAKVSEARKKRLSYHVDVYNPVASVKDLEEVVSKKGDYYRAYFNLGLAYAETGELEKGVEAFDKAISIKETGNENITDLTVYNSAGWVNMQAGNFEKAEALFVKFLESEGKKSTYTKSAVRNNLGILYYGQGNIDKAKVHFEIAADKYQSKSAEHFLAEIEKLENIIN